MTQDSGQIFLHPGKVYVTNRPMAITTVLGSCVSVILWDEFQRVGGMNHFLLPRDLHGENSCRYGEVAILRLLRMMREYGSKRGTIGAHIAGGASPVESLRKLEPIGDQNVSVARAILNHHRIPILKESTGGTIGYRVRLNTLNGEIVVRCMSQVRTNDWYDENGKSIRAAGGGGYPFERRQETRQHEEELIRPW